MPTVFHINPSGASGATNALDVVGDATITGDVDITGGLDVDNINLQQTRYQTQAVINTSYFHQTPTPMLHDKRCCSSAMRVSVTTQIGATGRSGA